MKNLHLNKSQIISVIYIQLAIFASLILVFWMEFSYDVYRNILVIVYFECVFLSRVGKSFNVYQIFLFMMFLFSIALPIFELFGWYTYPSGNRIMLGDGMNTIVSNETLAETYQVLITMLLGTSIGWLIGILNFKKNNRYKFLLSNVMYSDKYRNGIKNFFFILFSLVVYQNLLLVYYSTLFGYVEVMHLHSINLGISSILTVADILYKMSGYAILFQSRNDKEYIKYAVIFMIPYLIQAATGARGETIAMLLTIVFIYSQFFNQLELKKIIPLGFVVFLSSTVIGSFRFSRIIGSVFLKVSMFKLIVLSIVSNASSMGVIAYTIEYKDQFFNKVPFLIGYIHGIFSFAPNYTYEGIQNKNYLAQHITYLINPNKLFGGSTIGTSMGAEFYEFSNGYMVIIFILSIMLLYFAGYFLNRMNKNLVMFYLGAFYLEMLWLSPRGSIMKFFSKESVFSMVILFFIVHLSKSRKRIPIKSRDRL